MTIEERIERLERTNRRYEAMNPLFRALVACIGAAVLILALAVVMLFVKLGQPSYVREKAIDLEDHSDRTRIVLAGDYAGEAKVFLRGEDGRRQINLTTTLSGGEISIMNSNGKKVVYLGVNDSGNGFIGVNNSSGHPVITLSVDESGNGVVGAWNEDGRGRTLQPGP